MMTAEQVEEASELLDRLLELGLRHEVVDLARANLPYGLLAPPPKGKHYARDL